MKPVDQTKLHDPENGVNGNCMAASFASILELPLSEVPNFEDMGEDNYFSALTSWLENLGFTLVQWQSETWLPGYCLAMGMSERGVNHQVVFKNGVLAHDPHPSRAGIKKIDEVWALLPIDPSQYNQAPDSDTKSSGVWNK